MELEEGFFSNIFITMTGVRMDLISFTSTSSCQSHNNHWICNKEERSIYPIKSSFKLRYEGGVPNRNRRECTYIRYLLLFIFRIITYILPGVIYQASKLYEALLLSIVLCLFCNGWILPPERPMASTDNPNRVPIKVQQTAYKTPSCVIMGHIFI